MGSQQRAGGPVETINGPNRDDFLIHALLATFTGGKQHMRDLGGASTYATALNEDLTVLDTRVVGSARNGRAYHKKAMPGSGYVDA